MSPAHFARCCVAVALSAAALSAHAAESPVGRWQSIDDVTGKPRAIIRIYEVNGSLQGDIEKVYYLPGESPNATCAQCPEPQKGKPIIGLTVLWALKPGKNNYTGGHILDPKNATVYKCKMWLEDGGKRLDVRGYIGYTGTLGRTQQWHRLS